MKKDNNNDSKKIFTLLVIIFTLMVCTTGATYAYLAFSASDSNTVVGTTASTSLELNVERKLPSTVGVMVPQLEEYLGTAISSTYNCIDGNGNTVCQVYKATVTNTSTATVKVNGSIKFSGIENIPNLKWKRITNETTIGEYKSNMASTSRSFFERNKSFAKNESATYYFVVWIDETKSTQTDSGTFRATIEFTPENGDGLTSTILPMNEYATKYMIPTSTSDKDIDFSQTSEESNTNGVYYVEETKNDSNPIYYYRGNVNNNLIFANYCWKVVRTTETGGLKLIYNGVPTDGQCNNTGTATTIGNKKFNSSSNSPAYVGYMYGTRYAVSDRTIGSWDTYVYGNGVTYSNGTYTLTNTIQDAWVYLYDGGLNNYHYTCFTTETTCSSIFYISTVDLNNAYYITLTNGKTVDNVLSEMLDNNSTSSTIKGNSTTEGTLDWWYYTNIYNQGYDNYIEDTVWCNDRSISNLGGWVPNGGGTYSDYQLYFSSYTRVFVDANPSLNCSRNVDKFTVSEYKGNGALNYPVGLLTVDEVMLAGAGSTSSENYSYYLYSGGNYWVGSPLKVAGKSIMGSFVTSSGHLNNNVVNIVRSVRPSISLKPGFTMIDGGDGTVTSPYRINY